MRYFINGLQIDPSFFKTMTDEKLKELYGFSDSVISNTKSLLEKNKEITSTISGIEVDTAYVFTPDDEKIVKFVNGFQFCPEINGFYGLGSCQKME